MDNLITGGRISQGAASEPDNCIQVSIVGGIGMKSCGREEKDAGWAAEELSSEGYQIAEDCLPTACPAAGTSPRLKTDLDGESLSISLDGSELQFLLSI